MKSLIGGSVGVGVKVEIGVGLGVMVGAGVSVKVEVGTMASVGIVAAGTQETEMTVTSKTVMNVEFFIYALV